MPVDVEATPTVVATLAAPAAEALLAEPPVEAPLVEQPTAYQPIADQPIVAEPIPAGPATRVHAERLISRSPRLRLTPSQALRLASDGPAALHRPRPKAG